jgi:hypothetical protein
MTEQATSEKPKTKTVEQIAKELGLKPHKHWTQAQHIWLAKALLFERKCSEERLDTLNNKLCDEIEEGFRLLNTKIKKLQVENEELRSRGLWSRIINR